MLPHRPAHEPQPPQMPMQLADADDVISLDSFSFETAPPAAGSSSMTCRMALPPRTSPCGAST